MQWQEPITDRVDVDVSFADDNRGLLIPNRGARNYTDFKRIYNNLEVIRERLQFRAYYPLPLIGNEGIWTEDFFPRHSDINIVRKDVEYIRQFVADIGWLSPETPLVPNLPWTSYQKMNAVEQIILDIFEAKPTIAFLITGMAYTGIHGGIRNAG